MSSVFSVTASAVGGMATVEEMSKKTKAKVFDGELMDLNYREYGSPGITTADDSVKATLVLYFHDIGGEGSDNISQLQENSIISNLLSLETDKLCQKHPYVLIAPQCPAGKNWTSTTGSDYKFSPNGTDVIKTVKKLVEDVCSRNYDGVVPIDANRIVVIGVGNGATAAYDYFCRNSGTVSRIMTVGGFGDAAEIAKDERINKKAIRIVAPKGDKVVYENAMAIKAGIEASSVNNNFEFFEYDGGLDNAISQALAYEEPSVAIWAIDENNTTNTFSITLSGGGKGGRISADPLNVGYKGSTNITVTENSGYKLKSFKINGTAVSVSKLTKGTNAGSYKYTVKDITKDTRIEVEFTAVESSGGRFNALIEKVISWCGWLSIIMFGVAIVVHAIYWYENSLKKADKTDKQGQ